MSAKADIVHRMSPVGGKADIPATWPESPLLAKSRQPILFRVSSFPLFHKGSSKMKRLLVIPVLLLTLLIGKPMYSADYQKGQDAAIRGDFATALKELLPLAQQGHVHAQYNLGVMYDK